MQGHDHDRFIRVGEWDERKSLVLVVQGVLKGAGLESGIPGHFDGDTVIGVRHLQRRLGIVETGSFDDRTQLALYNLTGFELLKFHDAFHTPARRKVIARPDVPADTEDRFAPRQSPAVDTGAARGK